LHNTKTAYCYRQGVVSLSFILDADEIEYLELNVIGGNLARPRGSRYSRPDLRRHLEFLGHLVRPDIMVFIHIHLLGRGKHDIRALGVFDDMRVSIFSWVRAEDYEETFIKLNWTRTHRNR